jgi:hypothetical protein
MAIKIKTAAEIAKKWAEVTPARARVWEAEVKATPDGDWADPAVAAAPNWAAGVAEAASRGGYAAGIEKSRTKWKRKALAVGPARYGPGVRAAEADQALGFAPFREVIAGLTLTPRGPRGSLGNYERVREVGEALHNQRIGS